MTPLIQAAADLPSVCEAHGWRFCVIGGLAVLRWGEPRETVVTRWTGRAGFQTRRRLPASTGCCCFGPDRIALSTQPNAHTPVRRTTGLPRLLGQHAGGGAEVYPDCVIAGVVIAGDIDMRR
ncbi:MAG: hypothetical protein RJA55_3104 [Acidobacteriota bacterium]